MYDMCADGAFVTTTGLREVWMRVCVCVCVCVYVSFPMTTVLEIKRNKHPQSPEKSLNSSVMSGCMASMACNA